MRRGTPAAAETPAPRMDGEDSPLFTVFTPAYNRAHTLHRVYQSLAAQTFRDFEWLVVDDGSTDGTASLVEGWQRSATFPIRFVRQDNGGKHMAFNRGVREARGDLFLPMDSDDACVPHALERLKYHWNSIPEQERSGFSAVTVLCMDQHGEIVGNRFPRDVMDSDSLEIRYRYRVGGEKWGFHRTAVLRNFPFPEVLQRQYMAESVLWSQIARRYRTRFVNEALRIYFMDAPSMVNGQRPGKNAPGGRMYHLSVLNDERDFFHVNPVEFLRSAALYARNSLHLGIRPREQGRAIEHRRERLVWMLMLPAGAALYIRDRRRGGGS
ncbi:glycosyltransferase family 2 protein [soil metagenome]